MRIFIGTFFSLVGTIRQNGFIFEKSCQPIDRFTLCFLLLSACILKSISSRSILFRCFRHISTMYRIEELYVCDVCICKWFTNYTIRTYTNMDWLACLLAVSKWEENESAKIRRKITSKSRTHAMHIKVPQNSCAWNIKQQFRFPTISLNLVFFFSFGIFSIRCVT